MFPLHFYRSLQASSLLGGVARSHAMSVRHAKGDAIAGLGSIQTVNFSCTERNIYLGRPKWYKFDGWLKLQSSLNLRKRLASDHLFKISTSVFPPPETTVKLSFVSKCSHLRFRSWRFDNILSALPTSIFQCHHSWSSSSNLCHHYSITKLFTLANLQNN